jgi:hypothetical protein
MNSIKKAQNNNLEKIIGKTGNAIRFTKGKYDVLKSAVNNTPVQIKILNIAVPFILTYIFTFIFYNLAASIIFAIITFFVITLMSKMIALLFIILYIFVIVNISSQVYKTLGNPILQTDIVKNKAPYNCMSSSLVVNNNLLPQELNGGYYTYSFWIYINGNNNFVNSDNTWNNYRYHEWKSIMYRGTPINSDGDLSTLIQFPGFWLTPVLNNMVIVFQNGNYVERLEMTDIPFNTWMNYTVVIESKSVSVYINGLLDRTLNLYQNITLMNGYNLYLTSDSNASTSGSLSNGDSASCPSSCSNNSNGGSNGGSNNVKKSGFAGYLAEVILYNYALTPYDIQKSYNYYKKIIDKYQFKKTLNNGYVLPGLITNSDYYGLS